MTIRLSSDLRDALVSNDGLGKCLHLGHIRFYAGTQAATADTAPEAPMVGVASTDGWSPVSEEGGLQFVLGNAPGTLSMAGLWEVTPMNATPPTWWRFVGGPGRESMSMDGAVQGDGMQFDASLWEAFVAIPITDFLITLLAQ